MPDEMDRIQEINEQHQATALEEHFRRLGFQSSGVSLARC